MIKEKIEGNRERCESPWGSEKMCGKEMWKRVSSLKRMAADKPDE
jgi:hypothetical protein